MQPSISRIVHYVLTKQDAASINKRRDDAVDAQRALVGDGVQIHFGNAASEGDVLPMLIVKVGVLDGDTRVNGQVFLDGNDTLWVTSVSAATIEDGYIGRWSWPPRL